MSDLDAKTKDELMEIAASMDIEGRSSMTKDDLVKAIEKGGKGAGTSKKVTPVIPDPPEEPRQHERQGNPEALAETGAENRADQSSLGGTGGVNVTTTTGGAAGGAGGGAAGGGAAGGTTT